jgi:hypothetical protein
MAWFARARRSRPAPRVRAFLRLEELGVRATPSDANPNDPPPLIDPILLNPPPPAPPVAPPVAPAPRIDSFGAAEVAHGWYQITGHVTANSPEGLVIRFEGIPSLEGKTATADANGNFTLVFEVKTDGSDSGIICAQTTQNGVNSNTALTYINPTP